VFNRFLKGAPINWADDGRDRPKRVTRQGRTFVDKLIKRFLEDETAATAIEYGLIATGIALLLIATVSHIGTHLNTTFTSVNTQLR
jgi:pilus assembly protein Flp/PilA